MYEIDFLAVGDGERSGDAITMRFTDPTTGRPVVVVIDGGFKDDGEAIVSHINTYYGTNHADLVVSTHPDSDHIGGLAMVLTELTAGALCVHRPGEHGYANDSGADAAEELVELALAKDKNISVTEPFAGGHAFDHALMIGGPTPAFYEAMLGEQQSREAAAAPPPVSKRLAEAAKRALRRTLDAFPPETFFDDAGGDASARNNGAAVIDLQVNGDRMLFTSDVGVPGLTNALDYLDSIGRSGPVKMFQLPHHASRHNLDRDTIERVLGPRTPQRRGTAVASVSKDSSNPAPRVANAAGRRGFRVFTTVNGLRHYGDGAPERPNWSPAEPLPPLAETD